MSYATNIFTTLYYKEILSYWFAYKLMSTVSDTSAARHDRQIGYR